MLKSLITIATLEFCPWWYETEVTEVMDGKGFVLALV